MFLPLFWCCKFRVKSSYRQEFLLQPLSESFYQLQTHKGSFLGIFPNYTQREDMGGFLSQVVGWEMEKIGIIVKEIDFFFLYRKEELSFPGLHLI